MREIKACHSDKSKIKAEKIFYPEFCTNKTAFCVSVC